MSARRLIATIAVAGLIAAPAIAAPLDGSGLRATPATQASSAATGFTVPPAGPGLFVPPTLLAQRTIEREWGPSEDSVYVVLDVPGLKSEGLAAALSALVPGAGQLYVQEGSGWLYAALEAAGWGGWWITRRDANKLRDDAARLAGSPDDPASAWSFQRWATSSSGDPASIAALYAVDREAFYNAIASDPNYASGWADPADRTAFGAMRLRADSHLERARNVATALWINHLIAAVDALRAARFHNLPIRPNLGLKLGARTLRGRPAMALALEARFQ